MKESTKRIAIVALLILPALQPLFSDRFTCGYDNSFHIWRAVEVHSLLRQGVLYPRWAADMAHGYGYPLFEFAAPLSTYLTVGLKGLGLGWNHALNGAFLLGLLFSALSVYLLVRDWWGGAAGFVAAVAYTLVPYHAYDVFNRGGLSEATAWFLPPLILWALGRSGNPVRGRGALGLAVTALGTAALVLTHNGFALIFSPLLLAYALLQGWLYGRHALVVGLAGLGLGVGLAAFFWLPALGELGYVHSERLTDVWVFQYAHNFLSLDRLFALPRTTDPALINDWPPRALGLVPALVALLPLLGWRRLTRADRWRVALFLVGLAGCGLMTLPISRPLWDHLPLLPYVQFPWRFLGPAALCAAVLAGAAAPALRSVRIRLPRPDASQAQDEGELRRVTLVSPALIVILFLSNQGWFFPDHCPPPANLTVAGMIGWEQATDTLGTTAGGEYLPTWVRRMPDHPQLLSDYVPIRRLETDSLPPGAEIMRAVYGPLDARVELQAPVPFRAHYLTFYYPGWRVSIDGIPVEVSPSDPHGLITFDVPAGHHVIRVRFGPTPLRTAAAALSVAALVVLVAVLFRLRRYTGSMEQPVHASSRPVYQSAHLALYLLLACTLIAARTIIAQGHTPLRRTRLSSSTGQLRDVDQPYAIDFGHRWLLLGHDRLPGQVASGAALEAVLYWRALDAQGRDYAASLALVDPMGQRWTRIGMRSPRWHRSPAPVYTWPSDDYALTAYLAELLLGTPPGDYRLILTSFDKADPLTPLTAYAPDGVALGPSLDLGTIHVERPSRPPDPADVPMQVRLEANMGALTLCGVNLDREEAAPGDPLLVTLFWSVAEQLPDLGVHLALVDERGSEALAWELPAVRADWPTTLWRAGDVWRGQHALRLPAALESGTYTWRLHLYGASQAPLPDSPLSLGQLRVAAPPRLWQAPPLQVALDAELGQQATLLGANLQPAAGTTLEPSSSLSVTLVWRGEAEMTTSYRVFVHLLTSAGELLTQSDGEPASWSRPTSGWAPGEVVLDERRLDIPATAPAGQYTLVAGLYDPDTQERLPLPGGATSVLITTLTLQAP